MQDMVKVEEGDSLFTARMMSLGRITVPEPVRAVMGLKTGDIVEVLIRKKEARSPQKGDIINPL
jgi:bifunctional DNA-binding transcriptional regulator/antitoxin component of YhaV-PrlF toxin-antitoxin module